MRGRSKAFHDCMNQDWRDTDEQTRTGMISFRFLVFIMGINIRECVLNSVQDVGKIWRKNIVTGYSCRGGTICELSTVQEILE
jgi:hypothetical protein